MSSPGRNSFPAASRRTTPAYLAPRGVAPASCARLGGRSGRTPPRCATGFPSGSRSNDAFRVEPRGPPGRSRVFSRRRDPEEISFSKPTPNTSSVERRATRPSPPPRRAERPGSAFARLRNRAIARRACLERRALHEERGSAPRERRAPVFQRSRSKERSSSRRMKRQRRNRAKRLSRSLWRASQKSPSSRARRGSGTSPRAARARATEGARGKRRRRRLGTLARVARGPCLASPMAERARVGPRARPSAREALRCASGWRRRRRFSRVSGSARARDAFFFLYFFRRRARFRVRASGRARP